MIIGLLGFAGSGKGTVADILVSKGFKKESFADPVKDAVAAIFGWERSLLEGDNSVFVLFDLRFHSMNPELVMKHITTSFSAHQL